MLAGRQLRVEKGDKFSYVGHDFVSFQIPLLMSELYLNCLYKELTVFASFFVGCYDASWFEAHELLVHCDGKVFGEQRRNQVSRGLSACFSQCSPNVNSRLFLTVNIKDTLDAPIVDESVDALSKFCSSRLN